MSFFEDKEYDQLDWLNRAIEPFTFSLNDKISELEDEYILTVDDLQPNGRRTFVANIIGKLFKAKDISANSAELRIAQQLFVFKTQTDTIVDFSTGVIDKPIILRKTKHMFNDDELPKIASEYIKSVFNYMGRNDHCDINLMNEVMDLIGCTSYRNSRVPRRKWIGIIGRFCYIVENKEWNIRNLDLAVMAARWMMNYIDRGDLSAITNLTKLKCMTHSGNPIYSMKEIV